ncbi:MAG: methyl-accepting chemotaxis protein [Prolixibacteraceae bacterium]
MKYFENLLIRSKLIFSFGLLWMLFLVIVSIAYVNIRSITKSANDLHDNNFEISFITTQVRSHMNHNRAEILNMMLTDDFSQRQVIKKDIDDRAQVIDKMIEQLIALENHPEDIAKLKELQGVLELYRIGREQETGLIEDGKIGDAKQLSTGSQNDLFNKIRNMAYELANKAVNETDVQLAENNQKAKLSTIFFVVFGFVALSISIVLIVMMIKTIARPIDEISALATNISKGDLRIKLESNERKDEIGQLNRAFLSMVTKLRKQLKDIDDGINVLASSSTEIMAAVSQLASSSAETATSVSETTTTVEEVKQTALVSNLKAKAVSDNATRMYEISHDGNQSILNTIEGMNKIRVQMNAISGMVVKLSEQSQTIGEITATVNELAEQSNLLAVNAAIEAAKAGVHGKGFTVVAQEIKILSIRSKEATSQVRTILRDVQKSISSAVMATEEGGKAVDEGLKLTRKSGEVINALSESVTEASNAAIQIAASSQQQLEGMDQMVIAMESIREVSLQAATSTQQTVDSVSDLQKVGRKLDELMGQYQL